jgi:hypothetical protein
MRCLRFGRRRRVERKEAKKTIIFIRVVQYERGLGEVQEWYASNCRRHEVITRRRMEKGDKLHLT